MSADAPLPTLQTPATASATAEPNADSADSAARQQARQRFEAGMKLYEEGDYALALLEFERAHSLVPGYRVLYNIGQVNIQLGRYARATQKLRQFLAEGGDEIAPDRRASVLADLNMLEGRTANLLVSVDPPGTEIVLDNDVIATAPMLEPLLVDAGEHRLTLRKVGYIEQTRPIALAGRDQLHFELTLTLAPVTRAEKTLVVERIGLPDLHQQEAARRQLALTLGWTGAGLLATAWAATGYMGLDTARQRDDKLREATSARELSELERSSKRWYLAADVLGGLTLAATATLTYYTFFAPRPAATRPSSGSSRMSLSVMPDRVTVSGCF